MPRKRRAGASATLGELMHRLAQRPDMQVVQRHAAIADALAAVLAELVGPDAPLRCRPGPVTGGQATLICRSPAVAVRVHNLQPELLARVRACTGSGQITSIRTTVRSEAWE